MDECPHPDCFAPDTSCALGNVELSTCLKWRGGDAPSAPSVETNNKILVPWTGDALGLTDLSFITGRAKPVVVAIAGSESAGKTTLLASWYLLLGRGRLLEERQSFNGSYSLNGWEAVASSMRAAPGRPPTFPPHTTSRGARAPGLLHLALREDDGQRRDLLFADAPGEWFQKWAVNADNPEAEGARWLASHANLILLVADRQALSGSKLGTARNAFQLLAKRVAAERRDRPVALVWTKADLELDPLMESVIRKAVTDEMPDAVEHSTSVFDANGGDVGQGLIELFDWIASYRRPGAVVELTYASINDPLFLYGRPLS